MGGAQGLAITMTQGVGLIVEADRWRVERRSHLQQVEAATEDLEARPPGVEVEQTPAGAAR